ncbi:hypothetical protein HN51_037324 [Arachis hypogaea]|uniref:Uncharacterized protein n=1 Tax=Arachis hypogaea TaxID=3818 RepID=A0A444ZWS5_ARAHY|nr:uncharacterized protein LOC107631163 [Arachis ipaensis]XP_025638402.1 uncharacterized protein LOC112733600 [Arachis hypogaea]QHO02866.1 uncharacterized protein DS421_13g427450 [Arachis hypogaea]RYR18482.1 hypothetical protein Ahy_B03g063105 [Arachis hypogaea]
MAHLLTPAPTTTTASIGLSSKPRKSSPNSWKKGRVCCHFISEQHELPSSSDHHSLRRRALMGLSGALVLGGLSLSDERVASAAGRRPPPPPPEERKDPNVSGVQAKVLASKRRKEAMKEEVARLRERGKPIIKEPSPPPAPQPE